MDKIDRVKTMSNSMGKPPYKTDAKWMSRTGGKGPGGNGDVVPPNKAGFGLGNGDKPNSMSRSGGSGKSGSGFKLTHEGPAEMPRSDKGSGSRRKNTYGVGGV